MRASRILVIASWKLFNEDEPLCAAFVIIKLSESGCLYVKFGLTVCARRFTDLCKFKLFVWNNFYLFEEYYIVA